MCCSGPEIRGGRQKFSVHRWALFSLMLKNFYFVASSLKLPERRRLTRAYILVWCLSFCGLCPSPFSWWPRCYYSHLYSGCVCACFAHLYPCLCLHMALCLACMFLLYLPLCPNLYCNVCFLPIVLPLRHARESGAGARWKSLSLVALKGKANSEMHKHRKCCFPHAGSSWESFGLFNLV